MPDDTNLPGGAANELHGWKEIAAYLGKSVRAAQRWEQELGLPVRRIRTAAGQAIYARRAEIDDWLAAQEVRPLPDVEEAHVPSPPSQSQGAARFRPSRVAYVTAAAVILALSTVAFIASGNAPAGFPAKLTLTEQGLEASASDGALLWRHDFGAPLFLRSRNGAQPDRTDRVYTADVDGDGEREIYAIVSFEISTGRSDILACFTPSGQVRWIYEPQFSMAFRSATFDAPWIITDLALGPLAAGRREIWLAVAHHMWWPSTLVRVDMQGRGERRYTQSGIVYSLKWWRTREADYLLAGGVNNDFAAASLAVIDPSRGAAVSPHAPDSPFACTDCGTSEGPLHYFLLPRSDVNLASSLPYNRIASVDPIGDQVQLTTHEDPEVSGANGLFMLLPSLEFRHSGRGDSFWVAHRHREAEQRIDHRAESCPWRTEPVRVRAWTADAGWHTLLAPALAAPLPGTASN